MYANYKNVIQLEKDKEREGSKLSRPKRSVDSDIDESTIILPPKPKLVHGKSMMIPNKKPILMRKKEGKMRESTKEVNLP